MWFSRANKTQQPTPEQALPGRSEPIATAQQHQVLDQPLHPPFPHGLQQALFGLGCFWGAERVFWQQAGIHTTAVGYSAGSTPNPTYKEVCSGHTGHNEVVLVVFDPDQISYDQLLDLFWHSHNPTQGMRQGNDVGSQYRSGIYTFSDAQHQHAQRSRDQFQQRLTQHGYGKITTEILAATPFYYAEAYHQQYLAKNPNGYCGLGGLDLAE